MKNFFTKLPPEIQGGLLIILAFVIIGPNDILVPLISEESSLWQFHLCRSIIGTSLSNIGLYFGGRDHSTVIHAVKSIDRKQANDSRLRNQVNSIKNEFSFLT